MNTNNVSPAFLSVVEEGRKREALERAKAKQDAQAEHTNLLAWAKDAQVGIVHVFDKEFPYGGMTVAYQKISPYASGRIVKVAVANCSPEDIFNKRVGTNIALTNFLRGDTINLSLLAGYEWEDVASAVKLAFTAMREA